MATTNASLDTSKARMTTNRRALLSPTVMVLSALLLLQLLAALILGLRGSDMEPAGNREALLAFDSNQVTGIRIHMPDGEPVLLVKTADGWIIPAMSDLPAAQSKVNSLLSKLGDMEKGLPVATSEAALKRFKVAEDSFERKLTLEDGDTILTALYLGDSPGFRRLFVRADGDEAVYEAQIGLFDAPDKPDAWSDQTLLYLDQDRIQGLTIGRLSLERKDDGWRLADLATGEEQNAGAIEDLIRLLTSIDFVGVLGAKAEPAVTQEVPSLEIQAVLKSGETIDYRITKLEQGDDYLLEASNRPQRFKLPAYAAEELTGIARANLLQETEQSEEIPRPVTPPVDAVDAVDVTPATSPTAQAPDPTGPPEPAGEAAPPPVTTEHEPAVPVTGAREELAPKGKP